MKLEKKCIYCGNIFIKPNYCSMNNWLNKRKYCSKECADLYRIGKCFWSEKTKKILSKKNSGKNNPFYNKKHTKKTINKLKNKKISEKQKIIIRLANTGKNSHAWKGENAGNRAIHQWVERQKGKAKEHICVICKKEQACQWSNKNHKYKRNLDDWQTVCRKCHEKYDIKYNDKYINRRLINKTKI